MKKFETGLLFSLVACACLFCVRSVMTYVDDKADNYLTDGPLVFFYMFMAFAMLIVAHYFQKYLSQKPEENSIPEEGRLIRITWLKHCRNVSSNVPNPYIGMVGRVKNLKPCGSFDLKCDTCWLIVATEYKFEYLD